MGTVSCHPLTRIASHRIAFPLVAMLVVGHGDLALLGQEYNDPKFVPIVRRAMIDNHFTVACACAL